MDYFFNFTFTRPDEGDAIPYHVGMVMQADNQTQAERLLRLQNDHLTLGSVELVAIMNEDGDIIVSSAAAISEVAR